MTEYWFAAVREPPTLRNMLLDDDDTGEAERDIDGRKQIETDNNRDGLYTIGLFANSLFLRFAVDGGQAIVLQLRAYIAANIPWQFIQDGRGIQQSVDELKLHHLATLQSRLWSTLPRAQAAVQLTPDDMSCDDAQVWACVSLIEKSLATCKLVIQSVGSKISF
jgi:hypothetical protein